jgi:Fur family ferric uptake transcriptional regulator
MKSSTVAQLILSLFDQGEDHLTAQEVYNHLKPRLPAVNPSTVYRALERLAVAGKVSVSDMGQGAAVYQAVQTSPHHHLVCQGCRSVVMLEDAIVAPFLQTVASHTRFRLITNHLVLFGYCTHCQQPVLSPAGVAEEPSGDPR